MAIEEMKRNGLSNSRICRCSKSGCLQGYCVCKSQGRYCSDSCKCNKCKNNGRLKEEEEVDASESKKYVMKEKRYSLESVWNEIKSMSVINTSKWRRDKSKMRGVNTCIYILEGLGRIKRISAGRYMRMNPSDNCEESEARTSKLNRTGDQAMKVYEWLVTHRRLKFKEYLEMSDIRSRRLYEVLKLFILMGIVVKENKEDYSLRGSDII